MDKILIIAFSLFIPLVGVGGAEKNKNTLLQNSKAKQPDAAKIQQSLKESAIPGITPSQRHISLGTPKPAKEPEKEVQLIMSDPLMKKKWDLQKTNVKDAWLKFSKGNKDIIVAVIDTGTDINHPDLKANIWINKKEIPGNGLDDDKNGYVDDINGWNFVKNNNNIQDIHGHGTHIAGIIGAEGGNGIGISGVAPKVSLMTLKYYDINDNGKNNLNNTIKAIHYAVQNGAHIINYSGGGLNGNKREKQAIQAAERKGILFVAASGNEKSNMDKSGYYPAKYELSNILPVTATDHSDKVLKSSNWGQKTVHKSAPGYNILSTLPGGKYGHMTGTSQATAVATGAAVLVMDYYKNKTAHFVIKQLKMTGDIKQSLVGKTSQRRRLNIFKALQARGKNLNFMDEAVTDPSGKVFDSERDISSFVQGSPLSLKDLSEIKMVNEVLQEKQSEINPSKKETVKNTKNPGRSPSSKNQNKQTFFLKRWFFNKK
ncbi:MAG: S8 family peptidase [Bdellovibrionales bacterium]|nr:S8 family peptidase [Bdellovibrionales bacterium]